MESQGIILALFDNEWLFQRQMLLNTTERSGQQQRCVYKQIFLTGEIEILKIEVFQK